MSDKKLGLDKLKVQSFVTSFSDQTKRTLKGGGVPVITNATNCDVCNGATNYNCGGGGGGGTGNNCGGGGIPVITNATQCIECHC